MFVTRSALRTLAAAVCTVAAVTVALPAVACVAPTADEVRAIQVRTLQSRLMVAALSCDAQPQYDAFIGRFDDLLNRSGRALVSYFQRSHGSRGTRELNDYVTALANRASLESMQDRTAFCLDALATLRESLVMEARQVGDLAQTLPRDKSKAPNVCL